MRVESSTVGTGELWHHTTQVFADRIEDAFAWRGLAGSVEEVVPGDERIVERILRHCRTGVDHARVGMASTADDAKFDRRCGVDGISRDAMVWSIEVPVFQPKLTPWSARV